MDTHLVFFVSVIEYFRSVCWVRSTLMCVLVCCYVPAMWLFVDTSVKVLYLLFVCARLVYRCMEICMY